MDKIDVKPNIKVEVFDSYEPARNFQTPESSAEVPNQNSLVSNPFVVKEELILQDEIEQPGPSTTDSHQPPEPVPGTSGKDEDSCTEEEEKSYNLRETTSSVGYEKQGGRIVCTACQENFPNKREFKRHQQAEHKQLFFCETCDKGFDKQSRLKRHVPSCKGKPMYCAKCDKTFDAVKAWYKHRASHRNIEDKKFLCQLCHKPFTARSGSLQHEWEVHKFIRPELVDEVTICKMCNKPCYSKESYEQHLQSHMNITNKTFQCQVCEKCFGTENCLKGHMTRRECEKREENGVFNCSECHKKFPKHIFLVRHMRRHAHVINGTYNCQLCGKNFASNKELMTHTTNVHLNPKNSTPELETDESGRFKCPKCTVTYDNRQSCYKHILRHENIETGRFRCNICERPCSTKTVLEKHVKTHEAVKKQPSELARLVSSLECDKTGQFPCPECGQTFESRDLCVRHVKWHRAVEKGSFTCQTCGLSNGSESELKYHELMHDMNQSSNGESSATEDFSTKVKTWYDRRARALEDGNHQCEICGERFGVLKELKQHHLIHPEMVEEGPFTCRECGKVYEQRRNYIVHLRKERYLKEGRFQCTVCSKCFGSKRELDIHDGRMHN